MSAPELSAPELSVALAPPPSISAPLERSGKLPIGFKIRYGVGQGIDSLTGALLNTFLFFYLTNVCGLSGSLTGLALFLSLTVDALGDPLIGSYSDNLSTRWGRRVPVMALSLLPLAGSLGLLFSIPPSHPGFTQFAYILALLITLRVSISAFTIPYMGLGAELLADYDERTSVSGFRALFGIVATLIAFVLGFGVFLGKAKGLLDRPGYAGFGWTCAGLILAAGVLATHASLKAPIQVREAPRTDSTVFRRLFLEVSEVFRNPSFRHLFGGVLVFFVGEGVAMVSLGLDGNKYFWALSVSQIQSLAAGNVIGLALGLPLAFALIGRVEKRTVVLGGITILCAVQGLPVLGQLLGVLPAGVTFRVAMLVGVAVVVGMLLTMVSISFPSAMADAVDEHEHLFGTRREGLYFASLTFATKAALGLGSLISGLLLDAIHFPSAEIAAGRVLAIAPSVAQHLGWVLGPAATLLTLTSVFFFSRHRLDRAAHAKILRALGR